MPAQLSKPEATALVEDAEAQALVPSPSTGKKRFGLDGTQRATFTRLVTLCKPEGPRIALGLAALLTNSATNLSFPWILGQAVDRAGDPNYMMFIGGTAGIYLIGSVASWVRVYCLGTSTERISARLKKLLFNAYMDKNIEFYDDERAAELAIVLDKDVIMAAETLTDKLAFGVRSLNSSINGSILLVYSAPELCGISLAMVPFVGVGAMVLSKIAKRLRGQLRELEGKVASFALERFQRIATVRLNAQEESEKERFAGYIDECYDLSASAHFAQGSYMSFTNLMTNTSLMGVLWYGGRLLSAGKMTAGSLTRFAIQTAFVGLGWFGLAQCHGDMVRCLDAAQRVFGMIDSAEPTAAITNGEGAEADSQQSEDSAVDAKAASTARSDRKGVIDLRGVSFAYTSRADKAVLQDVSVSIPEHSLIGFAGKSGAGKSTLLAVICGLYSSSGGSIAVCGKEVQDMSTQEKRQFLQLHISAVQQNTGLLSGTIAENIAYGKGAGSAAVTRAQIEEAAVLAQADEFIRSFPEGYDTQVGEEGKNLSGGQQARIAIARALVKSPRCLLLDEATATLDAANETSIISLLKKLVADKKVTVVVFTHSEALMRACETLHVIDEGRVKHSGTYADLFAKGLVADVHKVQVIPE